MAKRTVMKPGNLLDLENFYKHLIGFALSYFSSYEVNTLKNI